MAPELNKPELKAKLRATRVAVEQLQHRVNDALERQKPSPLTREGAAAPAKLRKRRSLKGHFGKVVSVSWLPDSNSCLLYTSPSPRDGLLSRMPSSA